MRAAIVALGAPAEAFEVSIMQMVNLVEGGERARMSKRRGDFATLDDLLDDIGVDATRFFMLMRSHDTPIDIDLELARDAVLRQPRLLRPVRPRPDLQPVPGRGRARRRATRPATPRPGRDASSRPSGR